MGIPISNVTRRVVYAASGTGPYNFTFEILAAGDVAVYKDDALLTITTDYTVTINSNGTGYITLTASPTGATQIAIVGNRTIQRTTDFVTGGDFFANTVNDEMDQQTIFAQQNAEAIDRALKAPQTDPTSINMTLPRASVRANKTLAFDTNGNPTTGEVIGDNRGNWAAGTAYNKRDIVKDTSNGNVYYANTAHTSSGAQPISTNADSAKWDLIVDNASAGASATAAAASASAAATSASSASTSATNAASSASTASTQASNASTSASNAASSATAAASSASTASTAATNAGNSATAAATSATNASNSASSASTSATNASNSATSAATSASQASTSASNAASSASTATTQASNAATSATNAANSATASANSATAAAASAAAAAASFDAFDDIYLGAKSSDPTVDNDGNALTVGDQYFNTSANELRVWNGSTWQAASTVGGTVTSLNVTGNTTLGDAVGDTVIVNGTTTFNNADVTIYGVRVGRGAGAVSTNTAVGASALAANTTAVRNTGVGYQALKAAVDGGYNVAIGSYAGSAITSGVQNTAVGDNALANATTAVNNTGIGEAALAGNTTGGSNTAVGQGSLQANTTASNNTAVGYQAGYSNTTGTNNTALGIGALYSNGTTSGNTAIGASTLAFTTSGTNNTAVGFNAGNLLTTGSKNTIIGSYSGNQNGLDIRTLSNRIVLSDGDGHPALVSIKGGSSWTTRTNSDGGNASFAWTVSNVLKFDAWVDVGASDRLQITDSDYSHGVILSQNSNAWSAYSDERLKQNITPVTSGIDVVMALEPVNYEWKKDSQPDVGFVAQRTKVAAPMAVVGEESDFYIDEEGRARGAMAVMHDKLIPYMVKAIQELKADLDATKAELAALKGA